MLGTQRKVWKADCCAKKKNMAHISTKAKHMAFEGAADHARAHVGALSVVVVAPDGRTVQKHFYPSAVDIENPLCVRVHEDGNKVTVLAGSPSSADGLLQDCVPLEGMHLARKEAEAHLRMQGVGLPTLLTSEPIVRFQWSEMEGEDSAAAAATAATATATAAAATAPFPWKGAVACLRFAYAGPNLAMCVSDGTVTAVDILRAVPSLLEALVWYFSHGCIHQDIKLSSVLYDASSKRLSFCGLQLATVDDFVFFMNSPKAYAYFPRDYVLYAAQHGRLPDSSLAPEVMYADWEAYTPHIDAMNDMLVPFGVVPASAPLFRKVHGRELATEYAAFFGAVTVEAESEYTLRCRMTAVDSYMLGFTMLDFLARKGLGVGSASMGMDMKVATAVRSALGIFAAMAHANVRERLCARDAISQWNVKVSPLLG